MIYFVILDKKMVVAAQSGKPESRDVASVNSWIPAFAGKTSKSSYDTVCLDE